jgi:hypothetical protein
MSAKQHIATAIFGVGLVLSATATFAFDYRQVSAREVTCSTPDRQEQDMRGTAYLGGAGARGPANCRA